MKFYEKLSKLRKENNLSQEQLADKLNVSRQAVSKWESGATYPEMDKLLILCKLFNCSLDELVNDKQKLGQDKNSINKNIVINYINEFLDFITNSIGMFSSMKFKQKIKCLFEMGIITVCMLIIYLILSSILSSVAYNFLYSIFNHMSYSFINCLKSLFTLAYLIISVVVLIHIFKVRYLDYYIKFDEVELRNECSKTDDKIVPDITFPKEKSEKIVIRDPKHSIYNFFSVFEKISIFLTKILSIFFVIPFIGMFVFLSFLIIICIVNIFKGLVFFGFSLTILAALIICFLVIKFIYNFIFNIKINFKSIFIIGIISLAFIGIGFGVCFMSILSFKESYNGKYSELETKTLEFNATEELELSTDLYNYETEIVIDDSLKDEIKFVLTYNKNYYKDVELVEIDNYYEYDFLYVESNKDTLSLINTFNMILDSIKEKQTIDFDKDFEIKSKIYVSERSLEKIQNIN